MPEGGIEPPHPLRVSDFESDASAIPPLRPELVSIDEAESNRLGPWVSSRFSGLPEPESCHGFEKKCQIKGTRGQGYKPQFEREFSALLVLTLSKSSRFDPGKPRDCLVPGHVFP